MISREELQKIGQLIKEPYCKYFEYKKLNPVFNQEITYQIFFEDYKTEAFELTDEIMETLHFFLSFGEEELNWIKPKCYEHFIENASNTTYGGRTAQVAAKHNNDCLAANREVFGIFNEAQAFEAAALPVVTIQEDKNEVETNTQLSLDFEVPWEEEHGMRFIFVNKEFIEID